MHDDDRRKILRSSRANLAKDDKGEGEKSALPPLQIPQKPSDGAESERPPNPRDPGTARTNEVEARGSGLGLCRDYGH